MLKEKKAAAIEDLTEKLSRTKVAIVVDYRGIPAGDIYRLRRKMREAGIEFHVVKNTLTRFAAQKAGKDALVEVLPGPSAIAFGYTDEIKDTRSLMDYLKTSKINVTVKGAVLNNTRLSLKDIEALATLPGKEQLIGRLLGQMQAPIASFINVLNGNLQGLMNVLNARMKQLESPAS